VRLVLIAGVVLAGSALGSAARSANSQPGKSGDLPPERLPELTPAPDAPVAPGGAPKADPHAPYGVGKAPFAHRAATSCAAASCHGAGQVGKKGSEHTTWSPEAFPQGATDPHSKAYRVLFNPVSTEMARKLGLGAAHTASVCLKCHAVETNADPEIRDQMLSEGVGCSACHGPADKWVSEHYMPAWKKLSNREKWEKYGFVPAGNLVARTLNCAGCHLGDADHDLNHDLYAAGHPRITFEAARMHYQPDYRKHWVERTPQPDFEVRLWVIGQIATLRSAVDLLHARATRAASHDPKTPWPEFAGYSCYSCHQRVAEGDVRNGLSDSTSVQPNGKPLLRQVGVPGWEVWSTTAIDVAAEYCKDVYPGLSSPNLSAVRKLRETMGGTRTPPVAVVAAEARAALDELNTVLVAMQNADDKTVKPPRVRPELPGEIAHALAGNVFTDPNAPSDKLRLKDHDWDALAVNYLGCAAMFHATGGSANNKWFAELRDVGASLQFKAPPGQLGRSTGPGVFDKNKLDLLREQFGRLRGATSISGGKR
jgi:hypothetical protein